MLNKRNLIFLALLILSILLLTSCFLNPLKTEGLLKGQVLVPEGTLKTKDLTGEALPNATVNIIDLLTGEVIATTTTDANGNYQVFVPAGGPYLLEAASNGVKVQQITPQVEVGIDYDLGTANATTTTVALIVQTMLDEGTSLSAINLADIEADPGFDDMVTHVTNILEEGGDPTTSSAVNQAIQDFLNLPEPSTSPSPTINTTYTVIYDGNGHTDGSVPTDSNAYEPGESVTVLGNTDNLQKTQDGISLLLTGWNTQANGSGIDYAASNTFPMGSADIILYAQWSIIGGTGPAGGLVFHDKGSVSDGWRYLEAAPSDQDGYQAWSDVTDVEIGASAQRTAIGTGCLNTLAIISQSGHTTSAAQACTIFSRENNSITYDDWFLPSIDELTLLYANLYSNGYGDLNTDSYWSSSEVNASIAKFQYFYNNTSPGNYAKSNSSVRVRAIRAFRSTAPTYTVHYHANGATGGIVPSDLYHYEAGESVSVSNNTGSLVRTNYIFDGWNTEPDGSGTDRAESSTFNMGNDNVTLYAKWLTTIDIAAIPDVSAPETGATPVTTITETAQYTGTVAWNPNHNPFQGETVYTATITLTPKAGYTLTGVTEDFFTISGADPVSNSANSGVVTASFPETAPAVIDTAAIPGVTAPETGTTPVTTITATAQYTGTVAWSPAHNPFKGGTTYTATITLTPKAGYTLTGVSANFFTVSGATTVTNSADSGVVTAVFPETTYSISDIGPAGGYIFYINPNYATDGWRYLEVAPANTEMPGKQWSNVYVDVPGTQTGIGTGKSNTDLIVNALPGEINCAAQLCAGLTVENNSITYDDWFLPSKDELWLILSYSYLQLLAGFSFDYNYWTSSQASQFAAWGEGYTILGISGWYYAVVDKNGLYNVRAIRSF